MKKIITILIILFIFVLVGALYGRNALSDRQKTVENDYYSMNHFPETMPDVSMDPMVGMPVF